MSITKEKNGPVLSAYNWVHKELNRNLLKTSCPQGTPYVMLSTHYFLGPFDKNGHNSTFPPQRINEIKSTSQCLTYLCYYNEANTLTYLARLSSLY